MRTLGLILLAVTFVHAIPRPQLSPEDILKGADDETRYSTNEDQVDDGLLGDVFGQQQEDTSQSNQYETSPVKQIVSNASDECSYYADQDYECVPYYNCEDGEIITDGGGLIDIRSGFSQPSVLDPASSKCPGYLEVCCRHPDFATEAPTERPVTRAPEPEPFTSQCGRRNRGGIGVRIQNGIQEGTTQFGEWPHMCAVLEKKSIAGGELINLYVCGASLIAPGIVLTGAHCVAKLQAENTKVRCGEWDTQRDVEPVKHEDRDVSNIAIHPLYNPRNLQNDFALLFMEQDFILGPHIDTICLPDNNAGTFSFQDRNCVATGWGKDKFGKEGEYQVVLKQVEMDLVNNTECQSRLRRTRLGNRFRLHDSFLCAGGEAEVDTCKGDGGGPLVCPVLSSDIFEPATRYIQAGIVAWGIDCGVDGNPGVYANVADALCFIDWATDCIRGDSRVFSISGCSNWAGREIRNLRTAIADAQTRLTTISARGGGGTPSNIRNLDRRIRKFNETLNNFNDVEVQCFLNNEGDDLVDPYGNGDDDETDLASLARTGQNADDADDDDDDEANDDDEE